MCCTIVWHFKQNPDALMCFFLSLVLGWAASHPHRRYHFTVVVSVLTPPCASCYCSEEQETFSVHPKRMFIGAGIAGEMLRDTNIGASVSPAPLFSGLMDKAGFSQCICTMSQGCGAPGLCRTWLVTALCPCRPGLSLSQGTGTSELEGDGGPQGKS